MALAVAAMLLVPAAIAWACNPQAYLRWSNCPVAPGEAMQVSGAFFKGNAQLTLSVEPGGTVGNVTTSSNGFFATSVTAPGTPGSYTLSAVGYESDGSVTPGLPARLSFEVSAAGQPSQPGSQPGARQPGAPQPGAQPQPGAGRPSPGRFAEPEEPKARAFSSPGSGSRGGRQPDANGGGRGEGRTAPAGAGAGGVIEGTSGGGVFADSLAPEDREAALASGGRSGTAEGQRGGSQGGPAAAPEASAASDVWGGFGSAAAPSLTDGTDLALGRGTGSQLTWGLALLALGLVALVAGLAVAEVRRRRRAHTG